MDDNVEISERKDGIADSIAAVALVAILVAAYVIWVGAQ